MTKDHVAIASAVRGLSIQEMVALIQDAAFNDTLDVMERLIIGATAAPILAQHIKATEAGAPTMHVFKSGTPPYQCLWCGEPEGASHHYASANIVWPETGHIVRAETTEDIRAALIARWIEVCGPLFKAHLYWQEGAVDEEDAFAKFGEVEDALRNPEVIDAVVKLAKCFARTPAERQPTVPPSPAMK